MVEVEVEVEAKLAEVDEGSEMGSVIFFVVGLFLRFGEEEEDIGSLFVVVPAVVLSVYVSHDGQVVLGLPACVAAVLLLANFWHFKKKTGIQTIEKKSDK